MIKIKKIDELTLALIIIATLASPIRIMYLSSQMSMNPDERDRYLKKIKITFVVYVLLLSAFAIKEIASYYYQ